MRVLVTGGCGYIGTPLVGELLSAGHEVTVVDIMWFGNYLQSDQRLKVICADIRDGVDLDGIQMVIHLAAIANDPSCDLNARLAWEVNCLATQRLADAAVRAGVRQFVYASSGSVYGVSDALQVVEDTPLCPLSDYNKTKMVSERVLLSYASKMVVQIIRPATVCGISPRQRLDVAVNEMTIGALMTGIIKVNGGSQIRPNIHIEDMTDLYCFMLDHPEHSGIFNAGFENLRIDEIADLVARRFQDAKVQRLASIDHRSYRLNSDKLLATGFRPKRTVSDAISEIGAAYSHGTLSNAPHHYNMQWMQKIGINA